MKAFAFLLVLVAQALVIVACSAAPAPTPDHPVDPREVLRQAVDRVIALESGAFTLEHTKGTTVLLPGVEMSKVYGVADIPHRFRFTVEARVSNTYVETRVVVVDGQAYMTDFLTGQWQPVPQEVLPLDFSNLGEKLAGVIQAVQDPTLERTARRGSHDAYVIGGRVRSLDLASLVPNAGPEFDLDLELWVDRSQWQLLQVVMSGRLVDTDESDTVRVLTLDDIDVPVDITPPL